MDWEQWSYPAVEQDVYRTRLGADGPELIVVEKPGFQRKYATFSACYGSNDRTFVPRGGGDVLQTPAGIAHFLEHQMFDQPEANALQVLSALGVSPNAYTGHFYTVYLASTVERFAEALQRLVEFVTHPAFTEAGVEKEQGIIEQEIRSYEDHPVMQLHDEMMRSLYHRHPVRDPILGSVAEIRRITPELLFRCYETFYHPSNMMVTVVGDVQREAVRETLAETFPVRSQGPSEPIRRIERNHVEEPETVVRPEGFRRMPVSRPYVALGVKFPPLVKEVAYPSERRGGDGRKAILGELALDALMGPWTDLYQKLYNQGVVTDSFGYHFDVQPGVTYLQIVGQTDAPQRFAEAFQDVLRTAAREGIDEKAFERARRAGLGECLGTLDHSDPLTANLVTDRFLGVDYLERFQVLRDARAEDAAALLADGFREDRMAVFVIDSKSAGADSAEREPAS